MKTSKRNSNIELLRILAMFMIVLSHYTVHSGIDNTSLSLGVNRFLFEFCMLGNIGVIIFMLITGYYNSAKSAPCKTKKLLSMILQVFFYSIIIYFLFIITGKEQLSPEGVIMNILPITFRKYWFVSVFIILYVFSPYINILLNHLSRRTHFRFILSLLGVFFVLPMITTQHYYANELIQLFSFYVIGAYLRKYKDCFFNKSKNCKSVLVFTIVLVMASIVIFDLVGQKIPIIGQYSNYLLLRQSLASIAIGISIFSLLNNRKPFTNTIINTISACTFGVYLISDNYLIRKVLWVEILNVPSLVDKPLLILHMLVSVLLVFIICVGIEYLRLNTFERLFSLIYDKVKRKITSYRKVRINSRE